MSFVGLGGTVQGLVSTNDGRTQEGERLWRALRWPRGRVGWGGGGGGGDAAAAAAAAADDDDEDDDDGGGGGGDGDDEVQV